MKKSKRNDAFVCVFASSSTTLDERYYDSAKELGRLIGDSGLSLVFGAGNDGLMGALACGAYEKDAHILGVIPERLNEPGIAYPNCTELIVTRDMHERKSIMENKASAFIALPGGFGTLEELLEVITLKQLGYIDCPIVILNTLDFYSGLSDVFEHIYNGGFAKTAANELYTMVNTPKDAIDMIVI